MQTVSNAAEWRTVRDSAQFEGRTVGFVPTMGALHPGHRQLLERARAENDIVVLSIFVNRPQFNDPTDETNYPRTWERDLEQAREVGVDFVFAPSYEDMYPDDYRYRVVERGLSELMEGTHRPGHFDGVLTVVLKLLLLVRAQRAYFGEKDLQQVLLVRDMAAAFFLPVEIVPCPTVRDDNGLALSSRNTRLSESGREHASHFSRVLRDVDDISEARSTLESAGFEVDYIENYGNWRLGAVHLEGVRLIDNVRCKSSV